MNSMGKSDTLDVVKIPVAVFDYAGEYLVQGGAHFLDCLFVGLVTLGGNGNRPGCANILRYVKYNRSWEVVFTAPIDEEIEDESGEGGCSDPHLGFQFLETYTPSDGRGEVLLSSLCLGRKAMLLRSDNGTDFEEIEVPGGDGGEPSRVLAMKPFEERGMAAWIAVQGGEAPAELWILNPENGKWRSLDFPGITDFPSQMIQGMAPSDGSLYVAVADQKAGFQLWKMEVGAGSPWKKVLGQGALRYTRNRGVNAMADFRNRLYLASGDPSPWMVDHETAGGEIIRVLPDDRWQLIVGEPRFSPIGLQVPLSVMGPNFDNEKETEITGLSVCWNRLYAVVQGLVPAPDGGGSLRKYTLWESADGEDWTCCLEKTNDSGMDGFHPWGIQPLPFGLLLTGIFTAEAGRPPVLWILNKNGSA